MIVDAINKIKSSMEGLKEKRVPAEPIIKYLTGRMEDDAEFATLIMQEHKTLQKCFDFVYEQARNHLNNQNGWIDDEEVYLMAADYFLADDAELERQKAETKAKEDEKRKQREAKNRILAEERKAKTEADNAVKAEQKRIEASQKAAKKKQSENQLSLFDFGDDDDGQEESKAA